MMKKLFSIAILCLLFVVPKISYGHEVYVLDQGEINQALSGPHLALGDIISSHFTQFVLASTVGVVVVLMILIFSISKSIEHFFDPFLWKIKHYAPAIAQITLGLALISSAYYGASFGTELSFYSVFGSYYHYAVIIFALSGTMILLGVFPAVGSTIAALAYLFIFAKEGTYMINYATYFGEAVAITIWGAGYSLYSIKGGQLSFVKSIASHAHKYKFLWLRASFALSLIYAALYAKFFYADLAIETVLKYHLQNYFHLDPLFIVAGALFTEITIGLFYLLGFEIRFISLFFLFFLTLSIFFFGEAVWPHIILVGTAITMFIHGYDKYTIEAHISERKDLEPVF